jgi:microcystin degradation protein MlrC
MRVFMACLATETNTFAPFPTGLSAFEQDGIVRDGSLRPNTGFAVVLQTLRRLAEAAGDEVVESISAFAQPAGKTVRAVYEGLRDEILTDLRSAGEIDLVLLVLHGAMVAEGYDDCEGDIIGRARAIVPGAVIGMELDPHCHLTETMVAEADVIVIIKEYPHIDARERAQEMFDLCRGAALGRIDPVAALIDTRMIGLYPTFDPPMSDIVADLRAAEAKAGILSASIAHGFPYADVEDVGTRVVIYSDGDPQGAKDVAVALARRLYDSRRALVLDFPDIATSLERASSLNGRVVLGDYADNPGGGAAGDATIFLRALLERRVTDAAIGCFWDPIVANICVDAGVGAKLLVRLGGKCGSEDPLELEVEVMAIREDHSQGAFGARQALGRSVWLRHAGVDIAVCSVRAQVFEPDAFTGLGMNLEDKRLVVVKSSAHFQAGFKKSADHLWCVRTPGALSLDFAAMPYTKRDGDYFPRVEDPWALRGDPEPRIFRRPARMPHRTSEAETRT